MQLPLVQLAFGAPPLWWTWSSAVRLVIVMASCQELIFLTYSLWWAPYPFAHLLVHVLVQACRDINIVHAYVNTPATANPAIEVWNKYYHCFAFFKGYHKTLKIIWIWLKLSELGPTRWKHVLRDCRRVHARMGNLLTPLTLEFCVHKKRVK